MSNLFTRNQWRNSHWLYQSRFFLYSNDAELINLFAYSWYHDVHAVNFLKFMSPDNPDGIEPIPNSVVVNDKPLNTFVNIQPTKTYKLRLISMATFAMINFYIQGGVNMTIVAVDGVDCLPYTTDFIQIATAQRYDVLVQFPAGFNFKAVAELDVSMFGVFLPDVFQPVANISFNAAGTNAQTPIWGEGQQATQERIFDELVLQPLEREAALIPDSTTRFGVIFNLFSDDLNHGTFNNRSVWAI
jgi:iron transport multicopper oxidase